MSEPFDQDLYDRVMAAKGNDFDGDHYKDYRLPHGDGYRDAARVAARISAERQPVAYVGVDTSLPLPPLSNEEASEIQSVPVSDEELISKVSDVLGFGTDPFSRKPTSLDTAHIVLAIDAVRAALGPQVSRIPNGWALKYVTIIPVGADYLATLYRTTPPHAEDVHGQGDDWLDALTAAIKAAEGGEG